MSTTRKDRVSMAVWAAWFAAFIALELPAARKRVPWNTLSTTAWRIQERWPNTSLAIEGGLSILHAHITRTVGFLAGDGK